MAARGVTSVAAPGAGDERRDAVRDHVARFEARAVEVLDAASVAGQRVVAIDRDEGVGKRGGELQFA